MGKRIQRTARTRWLAMAINLYREGSLRFRPPALPHPCQRTTAFGSEALAGCSAFSAGRVSIRSESKPPRADANQSWRSVRAIHQKLPYGNRDILEVHGELANIAGKGAGKAV